MQWYKRDWMWEYFTELDSYAKCNICHEIFRKIYVSLMTEHLINIHEITPNQENLR